MSDPCVVCKKCGARRVMRIRVSGVPIGTPEGIKKSMRKNCELRKQSGDDCELQYYASVDRAGILRAIQEASERRKQREQT